MTLDNMVTSLQQLKEWYNGEGFLVGLRIQKASGVMTDDLIENLIALVEFVEELPSDLEQCKEKVRSVSYDSDLFDGAINQGLDRAIGHVEDFINTLENPEVASIEAQDAVEYCNSEYDEK